RRASARSVLPVLAKFPAPPKVMVPMVRTETFRPERPSVRYCMVLPFACPAADCPAPRPAGPGPSRFSALEYLRRARRKIGQYSVAAGPLERKQRFHHCPLAVDPAIGRSRLYHRILARYLIGEGRHGEFVLQPPDDVEIGQPWLDHDHGGAFREVLLRLAYCLVRIGMVKIVGLLVALQ